MNRGKQQGRHGYTRIKTDDRQKRSRDRTVGRHDQHEDFGVMAIIVLYSRE
ncbi:MAG: hypothetical protein J7M08_07610 [Planctomycetes bacterium]|nr:hypothetical protein [Planctomycetota bacterium]